MGSKPPVDTDYRQACEYRNNECRFANDGCKTERCGFYYRIKGKFSIAETIEELRILGVNEKDIRSLMDIPNAAEFRKQALFRFYRPV